MASETKKRSVGTVTVLFTDVVGSTELLDTLGDDVADRHRRKHFKRLRQVVRSFGGTEVKSLGDGLMVVFPSASDAAACAVAIQQATAGDTDALPVRVGLHTGEAVWEDDDLFGAPVVVARRLCDMAAGHQILASDLVRGLIGRRGNFAFHDLGFLELKGFRNPVAAAEVLWRDHPTELIEPDHQDEPDAPRRGRPAMLWAAAFVILSVVAAVVVVTDRDESPGPPDLGNRRDGSSDPRLRALSLSWAPDELGAIAAGSGEQIVLDLTEHRGHLLAPGRDEVTGDLEATMWIRDRAGRWSEIHPDGLGGLPGDQMIFAVVGRGRTLVAVGADGASGSWDPAVWTSEDLGRRWTRVDAGLGEKGHEVMFSVADNGSRFVAVGYASLSAGQADAAIWESQDGRSWTRIPHQADVFGGVGRSEARDVIATGRGFLAVGANDVPDPEQQTDAAVWFSPNGLEWERVESPDFVRPRGQQMMSVVRTDSGFLAAGFDSAGGNMEAALWTSPDARNWTRVLHDEATLGGPNDQIMYALARGRDFFAAAGLDSRDGDKDAALWLSLNGKHWRPIRGGEVLGGSGGQEFRGVVVSGREVVGAGASEERGDADGKVWRAGVKGL